MKSPIAYMGGKYFIADWIVSHFDYSCKCFLDLFGGGGSIILAKPPHKVEIFNDYDKELINFYNVSINETERLIKTLDDLPYSRALFSEWRKENKDNLSEYERAVRYFYIMRSSYAGKFGAGWSYAFDTSQSRKFRTATKEIRNIKQRFKNVQIECRDFREIIASVPDNNSIMLYADPPYYNIDWYTLKFTNQDHYELAELLNSLKDCKIAISYYPVPEILSLYPEHKWFRFYKDTPKHSFKSKNGAKRPVATELLLTNYEPHLKLF